MRIIFHIDANSAYLSWSAAAMLEQGAGVDIREIPAVIGGDQASRHGIVLARSIPAKGYGIATAQTLFEARQKCPDLAVFPPDYGLYMGCSDAMYQILLEYSPLVERYSIDECYLDYTASGNVHRDPLDAAHEIRRRIKKELGFTVNIGVSCNKLLAKMGSELLKPDRVHTLWPFEIPQKMWPLPVGQLFMVGRATAGKLQRINIRTIGDLAAANPAHMKALLKSHGLLVWEFANGVDGEPVFPAGEIIQKGVGNSTTIRYDVTDRDEAHMVLLALTERVGMRLRRLGRLASRISVSVKTGAFFHYSHQMKLQCPTDVTLELYGLACLLFDECWRGEPIRHLGVHLSDFQNPRERQCSLFDREDRIRMEALDKAVDGIRRRYGDRAIIRGGFVNGSVNPIQGGVHDGNFIMMGGVPQ